MVNIGKKQWDRGNSAYVLSGNRSISSKMRIITVLTLERATGFKADLQKDERWPGTITFTNVEVTGGDKTAAGAGTWISINVQPLTKTEIDTNGKEIRVDLLTLEARDIFLKSAGNGQTFVIQTPNMGK